MGRMSKHFLVLLACSLPLVGCSSDGGSASSEEFCDELKSMAESPADATSDPEELRAMSDRIDELAASAPEAIASEFELFAGVFDELASLEEASSSEGDLDDLEGFGAVMELMFDPEFLAASAKLSEYAVDECGFDPEQADATFGGDGADITLDESGNGEPDTGDAEGAGDSLGGSDDGISLDDLDEVKSDPANADWAELIVSSTVWGDAQVGMHGVGPDDEYIDSPPLTEEQAISACEAVIAAFGSDHPELEVVTGNGETDLVSGSVETGCAPV